jgi:hypothetical protein
MTTFHINGIYCCEVDPMAEVEELKRYVIRNLKQFPNCAEGVTDIDGVDHFYTYRVEGDTIIMHIMPREMAEANLNKLGMSTIEPWAPWPDRERDMWEYYEQLRS